MFTIYCEGCGSQLRDVETLNGCTDTENYCDDCVPPQ